ncbi:FecR domain-containing protein [Cupriavidus sp. 30B13]|uniref:FecR domain-containing protein n=1 Tax=Cupriavidus sp. 30B13 TaxID=3384241 RepID=UPI003B90DCF4
MAPMPARAGEGGAASGQGGPVDPAVLQRAARWQARLWSEQASSADAAACAAWRAADPAHERAWQCLQAVGDKLHSVPREVALGTLLAAPGAGRPRRPARRKVLGALGLLALAGGSASLVRRSESWQVATADYRSPVGELRDVMLPDGTRVLLDTGSAIDVRYGAAERRVILLAGQILVATAPDPAPAYRPFLVQTREGTARALGTRFAVRQQDGASRVAVFEGAVMLQPARPGAPSLRLDAGQQAALRAASAGPPAPVDDAAGAWARRQLVAEGMRVADFLAELARYRHGVLRCSPEVAGLRVSGVFPLADTDRALANLTLGLPVELVYRTRYWVTVKAREG